MSRFGAHDAAERELPHDFAGFTLERFEIAVVERDDQPAALRDERRRHHTRGRHAPDRFATRGLTRFERAFAHQIQTGAVGDRRRRDRHVVERPARHAIFQRDRDERFRLQRKVGVDLVVGRPHRGRGARAADATLPRAGTSPAVPRASCPA